MIYMGFLRMDLLCSPFLVVDDFLVKQTWNTLFQNELNVLKLPLCHTTENPTKSNLKMIGEDQNMRNSIKTCGCEGIFVVVPARGVCLMHF